MKVSLDKNLNPVVDVEWADILRLLFGREVKIPGYPMLLRNRQAYEAFNLSAPAREPKVWS